MTTLADTELIRSRWRRLLDRHALDTTDRTDFALGSFASRLKTPTVQILLFPGDPELEVVGFDHEFVTWLQQRRVIELGLHQLPLGDSTRIFSNAVVLADDYTHSEGWRKYAAVHRSGAIELGMGSAGGAHDVLRGGRPVLYLALASIVWHVWALLSVASDLQLRTGVTGPWQLTVGAASTVDTVLADLGEGWNPRSLFPEMEVAFNEGNLLWHIELRSLPEADELEALAFSVGDRFENAHGSTDRRFLNKTGERVDELAWSRW